MRLRVVGNLSPFGIGGWHMLRPRERKDVGEVKGTPLGRLRDLFAATEAVRDDERFRIGAANRWQEMLLADRLRDVEMTGFESE